MRVESVLTIRADHPAFEGHFPGKPIVPGVLLLDEAVHAIESALGSSLTPCQIVAAKFLSPVGPGEVLSIRHEASPDGLIRCEIWGASRQVAAISLSTSKGGHR